MHFSQYYAKGECITMSFNVTHFEKVPMVDMICLLFRPRSIYLIQGRIDINEQRNFSNPE